MRTKGIRSDDDYDDRREYDKYTGDRNPLFYVQV
jgi:hypothetical protein